MLLLDVRKEHRMAKSMSARKRRMLLDELSFLSRGDYLEVKWLPTKTEPFLLISSLLQSP
jgi:hypothetical protein